MNYKNKFGGFWFLLVYLLFGPLLNGLVLGKFVETSISKSRSYFYWPNSNENLSSSSIFAEHIELHYGKNIIKIDSVTNNKNKEFISSLTNKIYYPFNEGVNIPKYIKIEWRRPWSAPFGQQFTFCGTTQSIFFQDDFLEKLPSRKKRVNAHFNNQASVEWNRAFDTSWKGQNIIFQPLGKLIVIPPQRGEIETFLRPVENASEPFTNNASPNAFQSDPICPKDIGLFSSLFPEHEMSNSMNRAIYGGQLLMESDILGKVDLLLARIFAFPNLIRNNKPLEGSHRFSSYVGRFKASPQKWLTLNYQLSFNQNSLRSHRSALGGSIGFPILNIAGNFTFSNNTHKGKNTNFSKDHKAFNLLLTSQVMPQWSITGSLLNSLKRKKDQEVPFGYGASAFYHKDKFMFGATVNHQSFSETLKSSTIYMLTLSFDPI